MTVAIFFNTARVVKNIALLYNFDKFVEPQTGKYFSFFMGNGIFIDLNKLRYS